MVDEGLDVEAVRSTSRGLDDEGAFGDTRLDALLESLEGMVLHLLIEAVANLGDVVTLGCQLQKQTVVGAITTGRRGQAMGCLDQKDAKVVVAWRLVRDVLVAGRLGILNVQDLWPTLVIIAIRTQLLFNPTVTHVGMMVGVESADVRGRVVLVAMEVVNDLLVEVRLALHVLTIQRMEFHV